MKQLQEKRDFILDYLNKNEIVDVLDTEFHDSFHEKFGGKRNHKNFGCEPVYDAQKIIKQLYNEYILRRTVSGLGSNWQPGFPKWVYSYYINRDQCSM